MSKKFKTICPICNLNYIIGRNRIKRDIFHDCNKCLQKLTDEQIGIIKTNYMVERTDIC